MGLKKGITNNPHGRPKGSRNKATQDIQKWVSDIVEVGHGAFVEKLNRLDDREYIRTYMGLLSYVIPKYAPTTPEDMLRKEKEMLQELMLSMPDMMLHRLAMKLNEIIQKENENQIGQ